MIVVFAVRELSQRLDAVKEALTALSRLHLIALLASPDSSTKLQSARNASVCADLATLVEDFLFRHYQQQRMLVSWPKALHPESTGILDNGDVSHERLSTLIPSLTADIRITLIRLRETIVADICAAPVEPLVTQIECLLSSVCAPAEGNELEAPSTTGKTTPHKAVSGPRFVQTDPMFEPAFSLLEQQIPRWTLADKVGIPHFWTVCIKETLGAELCALSAVEYDSLPLSFYRDMAKQAWDEMRHAVCYLEAAIEFVPELISSLNHPDPLLPYLEAFQRTGKGLPIPIEKNLYEAMWNSTLVERLILFQLETEVPGSSRKTKTLNTHLFDPYPGLARVIEYDLRDERSHTEIGRVWLQYLLPESRERKEAIQRTELLRGVLVLTSFVHHGGHQLGTLMDHYAATNRSPS